MSCGRHHDTDCSEVLARVFAYIDSELDERPRAEVVQHLEECGPCLRKYHLERTVKALVARSCAEHAPEELRRKVLVKIRQVQVEIHAGEDATIASQTTSTTISGISREG
jgi:mycothiol system anti-sigma-R factor